MYKGPLLYRFSRVFLGFIFKLWYNPKIIGKENIPKSGAIIIACNHKHLMDQCLAIVSTKRFIAYMAKKEYFDDRKVAWFFKGAGCISVDRKNGDPVAKKRAIEILNNGGAIGIFPEGTRNKTDKFLLPFKFGAVSMAAKTDALIVPCGVIGDYKFRSKNLIIKFGKPFKADKDKLEDTNIKLEQIVSSLMQDGMKLNGGVK